MRGFEPRSRHHNSSACSPLHHTGKNSCCHTPETVPYSGSLDQSQYNAVFIVAPQREVATYILQPVDWLSRSARSASGVQSQSRAISMDFRNLVISRIELAYSPLSELVLRVFQFEIPIVLVPFNFLATDASCFSANKHAATPREVSISMAAA